MVFLWKKVIAQRVLFFLHHFYLDRKVSFAKKIINEKSSLQS